jgi:hypothetical protein
MRGAAASLVMPVAASATWASAGEAAYRKCRASDLDNVMAFLGQVRPDGVSSPQGTADASSE